jgi:type I restriction enzyme, S subunit
METVMDKIGIERYPAYKDSGVEWLGEIPEHWEVRRSKYLFTQRKELARENDVQLSATQAYGVIPQRDYEEQVGRKVVKLQFHLEKRKHVEVDDFVISMRSFQGGLERAWASGCIRSSYIVLKSEKQVDVGYYSYLFKSTRYIEALQSTANFIRDGQDLTFENFSMVDLPIFSIKEQTAIAQFLGRKSEQISKVILIKEKQIELLKERRQILIHKAVTRGLDPNVRMKDSGVEWIGKIPAHWEVKRIKSLSRVKRGASPRPIDDPRYFDESGEYSWVRIADVSANDHYLLNTQQKLSRLGASLSVKIYPNEIFVSIAGTVGKPMIAQIKCCIHDGFVYFPDLKINREYLYRLFETGQPYLGLGKHGTQLNLNTETIGNISIPLPPKDEQKAIVSFVEANTLKVDKGIFCKEKEIEKLKEYKATLINAAVTGKIKVV